jgi:hypothetical protein
MPQFGLVLFSFLLAGTAVALNLHPHLGTARCQKCISSLFVLANSRVKVNEKSFTLDLSNYQSSKVTIDTPSTPIIEPRNCSGNNKIDQNSLSNKVLHRSLKVLCGILLFLLNHPLRVVASATTFYSKKYNFWQNGFLALIPAIPTIVSVVGFVVFGSNSIKSELKSDIASVKSDIASIKSEVKADIAALTSKLDTLIASIGGRLDNQDKKIENAVKEIESQNRK